MKRDPFKIIGMSGGGGGGGTYDATTWDQFTSNLLGSPSGTAARLFSSIGTIAQGVHIGSGVIRLIDNKIDLSKVADGSPAFTVGDAASGANLLHMQTGSSAPTWDTGLKISEGAVLFDCLNDIQIFSGTGILRASAESVASISSTTNGQIIGGIGFARETRSQAFLSCVARNTAGARWELTYGFGDVDTWTVAAGIATQARPEAATKNVLVGFEQTLASESAFKGFISATAYAGDPATATNIASKCLTSQALFWSDTDHELFLCADQLTGSLSSTFSIVQWSNHSRSNGTA